MSKTGEETQEGQLKSNPCLNVSVQSAKSGCKRTVTNPLSFFATGLPRRLLVLLAFPGLNKNLWPLVHPGLSLKVDSSAQIRPLHLLKLLAEVLFRYLSAIRAVR